MGYIVFKVSKVRYEESCTDIYITYRGGAIRVRNGLDRRDLVDRLKGFNFRGVTHIWITGNIVELCKIRNGDRDILLKFSVSGD